MANLKLLLHCNGENESTTFIDSSSYARAVTAVGGAAIDSSQGVFAQSGHLPDVNASLTLEDSPDWRFLGDFTIDCRIRLGEALEGYQIFLIAIQDAGAASWLFAVADNDGTIVVLWSPDSSHDFSFEIPGGLALDTWYHLAGVRHGTDFMVFLDGVQIGTTETTDVVPNDLAGPLTLFSGAPSRWVDELRIVNGEAMWTAPFTPPSEAYADEEPEPSNVGTADITLPVLMVLADSPGAFLTIPLEVEGESFRSDACLELPSFQSTGSVLPGTVISGVCRIPPIGVAATALAGNAASANLSIGPLSTSGQHFIVIEYNAALSLPTPSLEADASQVLEEIIYRGVAINLHNSGISEYDGFGFNSVCLFAGKHLAANAEGIHFLDGDRDSGEAIDAGIRSGVVIDSSLPEKKRATEIYPSIKTDGGYFLGTISDGNYSREYESDDGKTSMHNGKIQPARGIISNYWGVSFRNKEGADFELQSIELITEAGNRL
jgi:hypothetical protein